ncbi:hypothetical protein B0H17DRAFT_1123927 [Mycena rosella]|uniref:Uncharacterized protein n=1 Tax=Mycena rosella TaxID=1033263 RepID=A0AAD7H2Q6_MYCRO|nr:hypothetical protein B0H17DRAFT_1123927 [Mycena rosella]
MQSCPAVHPLLFGPASPVCAHEDRLWPKSVIMPTRGVGGPPCAADLQDPECLVERQGPETIPPAMVAEHATHHNWAIQTLLKAAGGPQGRRSSWEAIENTADAILGLNLSAQCSRYLVLPMTDIICPSGTEPPSTTSPSILGIETSAYSVFPNVPNWVFIVAAYTDIAYNVGQVGWSLVKKLNAWTTRRDTRPFISSYGHAIEMVKVIEARRDLKEAEASAFHAMRKSLVVFSDRTPYTYPEIRAYNAKVDALEDEFYKNMDSASDSARSEGPKGLVLPALALKPKCHSGGGQGALVFSRTLFNYNDWGPQVLAGKIIWGGINTWMPANPRPTCHTRILGIALPADACRSSDMAFELPAAFAPPPESGDCAGWEAGVSIKEDVQLIETAEDPRDGELSYAIIRDAVWIAASGDWRTRPMPCVSCGCRAHADADELRANCGDVGARMSCEDANPNELRAVHLGVDICAGYSAHACMRHGRTSASGASGDVAGPRRFSASAWSWMYFARLSYANVCV